MMPGLSGRVLRRSRGQASVPDRLRERLVDGMGLWKAQLAYDTTILGLLTANPGNDPTGVERATTALHMYGAVEAIEEFEDALVRLEDGHYGTCQSCGLSIPIARLEVLPQTRFCAACHPADRRLESRHGRGRPEDLAGVYQRVTGSPPGGQPSIRVCSPRAQPAIRHRSATSMCLRTRHRDEQSSRVGRVTCRRDARWGFDVCTTLVIRATGCSSTGLWPRGVTKADAALDEWLKDAAPSTELRRWYGHDVERFEEFARRYRAELRRPPASAAVDRLVELARTQTITLLTATRDVEHSGARVLHEVLTRRARASR